MVKAKTCLFFALTFVGNCEKHKKFFLTNFYLKFVTQNFTFSFINFNFAVYTLFFNGLVRINDKCLRCKMSFRLLIAQTMSKSYAICCGSRIFRLYTQYIIESGAKHFVLAFHLSRRKVDFPILSQYKTSVYAI